MYFADNCIGNAVYNSSDHICQCILKDEVLVEEKCKKGKICCSFVNFKLCIVFLIGSTGFMYKLKKLFHLVPHKPGPS